MNPRGLIPVLSRTEDTAAAIVFGMVILGAIGIGVGSAIWTWWKNDAVRRRLRQFFGRPYRELPVVSRPFSILDVPNIRRAVEAFAAAKHSRLEVLTVGPI